VSGVPDLDDRTKNAGGAVAEWSAHFLGKVLLAELEQCPQGIFFSYIPMQNNQWFSMERKNTHDPKWVYGLCAVFPGRERDTSTFATVTFSLFHGASSTV
jgi:hypothetical protein